MSEGIDIRTTMAVGLIGIILTIAAVLGVQVLYRSYQSREVRVKITQSESARVENLLTEQEAALGRYEWVDVKKQSVRIPIERAMKLTVDELDQRHTGANP